MIPIYVCEDNLTYLRRITEEINNYLLIEKYDMKMIMATPDPFELLKHLNANPQNGIYFLDVNLQNDEMNGFQLGQEIRKIDSRGFIIFVTNHSELSFETFRYRLEAMDYIIKDDTDTIQKRLRQCLDSVQERILEQNSDTRKYFSVKVLNEIHNIPLDEILYFETSSQKHRIILYTEEQQLEFFGNLQEVEQQLNENFIRVHRSFLVSKDKITTVDLSNNTLTLVSGHKCLIARNKKKTLKDMVL